MKLSSSIYHEEDFMHSHIDGQMILFGFVSKHDHDKVIKNKKQVQCVMLCRQKAEMLRDRLTSFLEYTAPKKKEEAK